MTNIQIIETECVIHNINEEVNTYDGWKRQGYQVQKGQKALFTTTIWKPVKVKDGKTTIEDTEKATKKPKMIMVKAAFFGESQVAERK